MQTYRYTLRLSSAVGTPLAAGTLFGQLCWVLRHRMGHAALDALLQGYTDGKPFAVLSDAFPSGHVPLPHVPSHWWEQPRDGDRKQWKKRRWLPVDALRAPTPTWQQRARSDKDVFPFRDSPQPHNTINRGTGTTGKGAFAPYVMPQTWFDQNVQCDLYIVLDTGRLSLQACTDALEHLGQAGFGRDASIGLGKFALTAKPQPVQWPTPDKSNAYLTLAPCAPQGLGFCPRRSSYQVWTHFGRHGDIAVLRGQPFKRPVLLAKAGAVLWPEAVDPTLPCIGQGIGGLQQPLSAVMPETVHQGYAPVIPISCPKEKA
ncbi:type III-A CRISPR-associated RAMP protein Csm4 [Candidatus Symbiobacter mobilis]|uniref:CRISPR system Cms protein Csm4 n=1 Tax=Candidatus Symbiobacter mobilis CR TaxID=946483 RepID=U5N9R8_9BURK|nr:hypothetical protein [Candidatus Symbiobacter mobilis]AGX86914.1 hypothetical protein Cenrod_0808 [Candidatus Symbiobacter mobilis CR]